MKFFDAEEQDFECDDCTGDADTDDPGCDELPPDRVKVFRVPEAGLDIEIGFDKPGFGELNKYQIPALFSALARSFVGRSPLRYVVFHQVTDAEGEYDSSGDPSEMGVRIAFAGWMANIIAQQLLTMGLQTVGKSLDGADCPDSIVHSAPPNVLRSFETGLTALLAVLVRHQCAGCMQQDSCEVRLTPEDVERLVKGAQLTEDELRAIWASTYILHRVAYVLAGFWKALAQLLGYIDPESVINATKIEAEGMSVGRDYALSVAVHMISALIGCADVDDFGTEFASLIAAANCMDDEDVPEDDDIVRKLVGDICPYPETSSGDGEEHGARD